MVMPRKPLAGARAMARATTDPASSRALITQRKTDQLSARFLQLREQLARDAVETMREMGKVLHEARTLLGRDYGLWIREELGISRAAASNYKRVFEMSESTPKIFVEKKDLGPSKIIRLARVAPDKRSTALNKKVGRKTVAAMTDAEFALVTKPYLQRQRKVSGNMKAHGLRMKLAALMQTLRGAKRYPKISDDELRRRLAADLEKLATLAHTLAHKLCP